MDLIEFARSKKQASIPTNVQQLYLSIFSHEIFYPASASLFLRKILFLFPLYCICICVLIHIALSPTQQAVSPARCFCRKKSPALLPAHPMSPYNLFLHSVTDSSSKLFAIWNIVLCFCPPVLSMSPYPTTCFYIDSSSLKSAFFTSWSF